MKTGKKLLGAGVLSAIAASFCCIAPLLAVITGGTGLAASFSWLEPARPFFIALTIVTLALAWYQKLKPQKQEDCNCEPSEKSRFTQSYLFLVVISLFALLMLAFPIVKPMLYSKTNNKVQQAYPSDMHQVAFTVRGMSCASCEDHVNQAVNKLPGIIQSTTSYKYRNSLVSYDSSKTNINEIINAINSTGYKVTDVKEK